MSVARVAVLLALVVATASATVSCPKTKAAFAKFISASVSDDLIDLGFMTVYNDTQKGVSFSKISTDLSDNCSNKLLQQSAFYGPAMQLYTGLSDWQTVLNKAVAQIKKSCKPYYVNKLLKNKPKTVAAFDKKIAGWIVKKVVRSTMLNIKGAISAADWKQILSDLWTPVKFSANGFTKP